MTSHQTPVLFLPPPPPHPPKSCKASLARSICILQFLFFFTGYKKRERGKPRRPNAAAMARNFGAYRLIRWPCLPSSFIQHRRFLSRSHMHDASTSTVRTSSAQQTPVASGHGACCRISATATRFCGHFCELEPSERKNARRFVRSCRECLPCTCTLRNASVGFALRSEDPSVSPLGLVRFEGV
jgi:hypothetical protein